MAPVEDNDSGMESQDGSQSIDQEESKEKGSKEKKQLEIEENEDDEVMKTVITCHSIVMIFFECPMLITSLFKLFSSFICPKI